jgi:predicted ribonuclease YlaK
MKKYVVDTNVLLNNKVNQLPANEVVIPAIVLRELDKHKISSNGELAFKARRAVRWLVDHEDEISFDLKDYTVKLSNDVDKEYADNKIIQCCLDNGYGLITDDLLLMLKAKGLGINVFELKEKSEYTGIRELYIDLNREYDNNLLAELYSHKNFLGLRKNEYLLLWDVRKPTYDSETGLVKGYEIVDKLKFDGRKFVPVKYEMIKPQFTTNDKNPIKPRNVKQSLLFDLLQNDQITVKLCVGRFGTGKDFIMINHALQFIEEGKIDRIVWVRNNVELHGTEPIGFLPGSELEKLMPYVMPLVDHLGGVDGLMAMIKDGKVEIQHLGSLRGRDIKNSIIYVTEAQNNTRQHVQLLLGRVGEGSQLWLNGDYKQTDKDLFRTNSGLKALTELAGHELFGMVTLDKSERSETATLADLLDE